MSADSKTKAQVRQFTIKAWVATPDQHERLRFLLMDRSDLKQKHSYKDLWMVAPKGMAAPFKQWDARDDGTIGEFWTAVPKAKRKSWLEIYTGLRGQVVDVTVKPRRYSFIPPGKTEKIAGVSLDLVYLEKSVDLNPAGK